MKKEADIVGNLIDLLRIRILKLAIPGLFMFSIIFILNESAHAQSCTVILKITDPTPVCSPSTIDLSSESITVGSTEGLVFSYYLNRELTILVPNPASVGTGTYYIKGKLTGSRTAWAASSIKVAVIEKPKVVVTPSVLKSQNDYVDLTLPLIKLGSDEGLTYSYWYDIAATKPLLSPESVGKGNYYIKGTSINGCSEIKAITVYE